MDRSKEELIWIACPLCDRNEAEVLFDRQGFQHVRCRNCGLTYVNPQQADAPSVNAELYGHGHPEWSEAFQRYSGMSDEDKRAFLQQARENPGRKYLRELKILEPFRKNNCFLDVGSGDGRFMLAAQGQGWRASGVEVARETATLCTEVFGLDVQCATLEDAVLAEGGFDAVRFNQVIEHTAHPLRLLRTIRRALRTGGVLSLSTINIRSFTYLFMGRDWASLGTGNNGHIAFFSKTTLLRALLETGFRPFRWITTGCRIRNTGAYEKKGLTGRTIRGLEKSLGWLAGLGGWGGRIQVFAQAVELPSPKNIFSRGVN